MKLGEVGGEGRVRGITEKEAREKKMIKSRRGKGRGGRKRGKETGKEKEVGEGARAERWQKERHLET